MPNGRTKRCMLRAIGQGQQMRGINIDNIRPDIAVVDDVEDNENTESETQQKKLDKWMFGPFLKALARKKKILWLGNMLTKTSLLARLSRNIRWNPVVFGCLVKDAVTGALLPLWPNKWSVAALKEDFKEYRDLGLVESWMCEMMNMPGHGENGFTAESLNYLPIPTPDDCQACWITVDPALGSRPITMNRRLPCTLSLGMVGLRELLPWCMDISTMFDSSKRSMTLDCTGTPGYGESKRSPRSAS
jgi:hypothetical protein